MLEQHLLNLLVKLALSAALASILTRFGAFQRMLMREERTLSQRVHMALVGALAFGAGVATTGALLVIGAVPKGVTCDTTSCVARG